jgi:predicted lipase
MCVAKSLDGRLLCASECAYEIENPYFQGVGYLAGTTAKRISQGVNSCLVGRTIDGIVVAFRGTQAGNMLEWLQNAAVFLQTVKSVPGSIHAGFYQAVKNMYEPVKQSILQMMKDSLSYRPKKIYLTGHSKGGSMASLTAVMMQQDHEIPNAHYVCSFGASRVGDSAFRTHFNRTINQTTYENSLDIVPFLPPGHETIEDMNQTMTDKMDE